MQKSIIEFTEEDCYETLEKACWKNGIFCPIVNQKEL